MTLPCHRFILFRCPLTGTTWPHLVLCMYFPWNESGRGRAQKMVKALMSLSRTFLPLHPSSLLPPSHCAKPQCLPESPRLCHRLNHPRLPRLYTLIPPDSPSVQLSIHEVRTALPPTALPLHP